MFKNIYILILLIYGINPLLAQKITLQPVQGDMVCAVQVHGLNRQNFALGVPETIGSSEEMILNFPEVTTNWSAPDADGIVSHSWKTSNKIEYSVKLIPHDDFVDMEMTIKNLSNKNWTNVFSFNCLNPVNAPKFLDWTLERTYMSKNGAPFRMDGTKRVNTGSMKTVQFYLHEDYKSISPFVNGFGAVSPDKTDDSYIVTMSEDGDSYMAATSPNALFLFDNLDRCCIHSATGFGDIPISGEKTVVSRFYFAKGTLNDFIKRYNNDIKNKTTPRIAMCWGKPWELADTSQWNYVFNNIDVYKFYIGDILNASGSRVDSAKAKLFVKYLVDKGIKICVENGGLLDWYAEKGDSAAYYSFKEDYNTLKTLIRWIKEADNSKTLDMLDMDGPIRRMLFPNNKPVAYHNIGSAVIELFKVVKMWRDSVPGIELNLLTNFPNWAWGETLAYFKLFWDMKGYGYYDEVMFNVEIESKKTGLKLDAITIDNPYDYATGKAPSNQQDLIAGVDWMNRIKELSDKAKELGLKVNMIFNTNGGRNAQDYSEQTLAFIDLYKQKIGTPDGYWIQSWYDLPGKWLPEDENYTMTNITKRAIKKIKNEQPLKPKALLEPEDGRVYHGVQTMTFHDAADPLEGFFSAISDSTIQPAVRGFFMSIPGERGPANTLMGLNKFFHTADSVGFIPELSLFLVGKTASDSVIAVSTEHDWIIDSVITLCKNYGRKMFLRIGGEFNGSGEGWNGGGYHPYLYVTMFRKIVDMYAARNFRDSIAVNWCYEPDAPNDFDSVDSRGARWYPGDEYVDWFGLDVFDSTHFDQSLNDYDRRGITKKGKSERFLAMAREKGKPVFLSETSAKGVNISSDNEDGINDWNNWFAKYWEFIDAHKEIKGFAYIDANWPEHAYPGWGDARIENNTYIVGKYIEEMKKPKYIHLKTNVSTGIKDYFINNDIYVYPNPATDLITISNYSGEIEILNALGISLWKGTIGVNENIDISRFTNGIYYVKTENSLNKFLVVR